jgi:hypothetical protein
VCVCLHGMSGHRLEKAARRFACCAKSLKKFERKNWIFTLTGLHVQREPLSLFYTALYYRTVYTGRLVRHMFFDYLSLFLSTIIRSTFFSFSLLFSVGLFLSLAERVCVI